MPKVPASANLPTGVPSPSHSPWDLGLGSEPTTLCLPLCCQVRAGPMGSCTEMLFFHLAFCRSKQLPPTATFGNQNLNFFSLDCVDDISVLT